MNKVAFLISMPRSGSTILQRLIETDDKVVSCSEPWFMLPLLSIGNGEINQTAYGDRLFKMALKDAETELDMQGVFRANLYGCAHGIYENIFDKNPGKSVFLDKTPRYVQILPEIFDCFPDAMYIFLHRNPFDVLASYISTWCDGSFDKFLANDAFVFDFKYGLNNLANAASSNVKPKNSVTIKYESLSQGADFLSDKLSPLGLNVNIDNLNRTAVSRAFGDPSRAHESKDIKITTDSWKKLNSESLSGMIQFFSKIPSQFFVSLGYNKEDTLSEVDSFLVKKKLLKNHGTSLVRQQKTYRLGVAINTFNTPSELLLRAVVSCCKQSRKPDSILIYDDASTVPVGNAFFSFLNVLRNKFESIDIKYIAAKENKGIAFARDKALCLLEDDLVTHLDADDYFFSRKLEMEEMQFLINPDISENMVACSDVLLKKEGTSVNKKTKRFCDSKDKEKDLLLRSTAIPRDIMISKSAYLESARFDPLFEIYEDYHHKLRLANKGFLWFHSGVVGTVYQRSSDGLSRREEEDHVKFEELAYRSVYPDGHPSLEVDALFKKRIASRLL